MALKLRVLQRDFGPVDNVRAAIFGGVMFPTGTNSFGSTSFNPCLGAVVTGIFDLRPSETHLRGDVTLHDGLRRHSREVSFRIYAMQVISSRL